jgi:hypothetical protein
MKTLREFTDNCDTYIEIGIILVLNQAERAEFLRHQDDWGSQFTVRLPFDGMNFTDRQEFLATGEITLSYWQDKDCRIYEGDEREIQMMESMLADDMNAVRRMAKVRDRRQPTKPSWMHKNFWGSLQAA